MPAAGLCCCSGTPGKINAPRSSRAARHRNSAPGWDWAALFAFGATPRRSSAQHKYLYSGQKIKIIKNEKNLKRKKKKRPKTPPGRGSGHRLGAKRALGARCGAGAELSGWCPGRAGGAGPGAAAGAGGGGRGRSAAAAGGPGGSGWRLPRRAGPVRVRQDPPLSRPGARRAEPPSRCVPPRAP